MSRKIIKVVVCLVFLATSGSAFGGTLDVDISINWDYLTANSVVLNGTPMDVYAGNFYGSNDAFQQAFAVFCVELTQGIGSGGPYTFAVNNLTDVAERYQRAGWLLDAFGELIGTAQSGALQLAIWEVVYDYDPNVQGDGFDFSSGNFVVSTAASGLQSLLPTLTGAYQGASMFDFDDSRYALYTNDQYQDLIGTRPVPEPATMLLFGVGLAGIVSTRMRRKK